LEGKWKRLATELATAIKGIYNIKSLTMSTMVAWAKRIKRLEGSIEGGFPRIKRVLRQFCSMMPLHAKVNKWFPVVQCAESFCTKFLRIEAAISRERPQDKAPEVQTAGDTNAQDENWEKEAAAKRAASYLRSLKQQLKEAHARNDEEAYLEIKERWFKDFPQVPFPPT
jgi:hypothetical protein